MGLDAEIHSAVPASEKSVISPRQNTKKISSKANHALIGSPSFNTLKIINKKASPNSQAIF